MYVCAVEPIRAVERSSWFSFCVYIFTLMGYKIFLLLESLAVPVVWLIFQILAFLTFLEYFAYKLCISLLSILTKMTVNNSGTNPAVSVHEMSSSVLEHTLEKPIQIYNPPEDEINFWMYAMIAVGCAFVVFVIGSIYLMCNNPPNGQPQPLRRHLTTRDTNTRVAEREHL